MGRTVFRVFYAATAMARAYARDKRKTRHLVDQAAAKAHKQHSTLGKVWTDFSELLGMIRAWASGKYSVVPWKSLLLGIAAVLYFVNPFDLVPDFLPLTGLVDDVAVLALVLKSLQKDLARFRIWQQAQTESPHA